LVFSDEVDDMIGSRENEFSSSQKDRISHLSHCLQLMSPQNRQLIEHRYEGENSMKNIAGEIGGTIGSVRVKLHRLRKLLLECIQNRMQEDGV
jgi:RNA polymerase sigma-70 factor (ECF subfamily)